MCAKKFRGKFRIDSARLKNYDYASNGAYFITIVTKNRENFFGKIVNGKMILNELGKIVQNEWLESAKIRDHIFLDEFVIMPNHFHGIVIIDNQYRGERNGHDGHGKRDERIRRDVLQNVSTTNSITNSNMDSNTNKPDKSIGKNQFFSKISPSSKSLSVMIRSFKSAVTRKSCEISHDFGWQSRFHDHIIRNKNELNHIRQYIISNPELWYRDRNKNRDY